MLKINNLTVNINDKKVLNGFNLNIDDGSIHVIMGKNGIGKSTLCKVLMRDTTYEVVNGDISFNNKDLLNMETNDIANEGMMLINQNPISIEGVTNAEMLRIALREKTKQNINIFEFNKKLEQACDKLNLDKAFIHKDINVGASGGERKKIELLHVDILRPSFLILDELDSGLDVDSLKVVCNYLNKYHKETGCSILMITHHPLIIDYIKPNYVHVLDQGKIIKTGDYHLAEQIEKEGFLGSNNITESDKNE